MYVVGTTTLTASTIQPLIYSPMVDTIIGGYTVTFSGDVSETE